MPGTLLEGLDDIIHGRLRLGVMAFLASSDAASFGELKTAIGASDGNLSAHLRKLEDAGYIAIDKSFRNRRPLTTASLTPKGRTAWRAYLEKMRTLIEPPGEDGH